MAPEDVFAEGLGVEFLGLDVIAGEAVFGVGDEDSAVGGAFMAPKTRAPVEVRAQTNIEDAFEGPGLFAVHLGGFGELVFAIRSLDAGESIGEVKFGKGAAGEEETGRLGGGPVGEPVLDAVSPHCHKMKPRAIDAVGF